MAMKFYSAAVSLLFFAHYALACTTLSLPKSPEKWVLKSYDWHQGHGTVFINPKGVIKEKGFLLKDLKVPKWTSQHGSLTFNQHGRDLPVGGINDAGLVIEVMWLNDSKYGEGTSGEYLNELQWIQYHLDKYSTVKQVIKSAGEVGISNFYAKVHYLVCDTDGECATIEYLDSKLVYRTGKDFVIPALTNDTYDSLVTDSKIYKEYGGNKANPGLGAISSLERFTKAGIGESRYKVDTATPLDDVMAILKSVGQGNYTKFNIAYDRKANRVYFRTHMRPSIKWIDLGQFLFKCEKDKGPYIYNMNTIKEGEVLISDMDTYTTKANKKLVEEGLIEMAELLPDGALKKVIVYPESFKCE